MSKKKIIILVIIIFIILFGVFYFIHTTIKQRCGRIHEEFECQSKLWCKPIDGCGHYKNKPYKGYITSCSKGCEPIWGSLNFLTIHSPQKTNKSSRLKIEDNNQTDYCQDDNDCSKTGCSNTLCRSKTDVPVATTCEWHNSYQCYRDVKCACIDNKCQFADKDKIKNCINQYDN